MSNTETTPEVETKNNMISSAKMNGILEKIFIKIKNRFNDETSKYYLNDDLKSRYFNNQKPRSAIREEIENGISFIVYYPFFCLKLSEHQSLDIQFLVNATFINDDNEKFNLWICSFQYLKDTLQSLGYKEAKLKKKKKILFSENNEINTNDKDSNGSSSESIIVNDNELGQDLVEYEVKVYKNPITHLNIFDRAQKPFNPFENNENLEDYIYDLDLPKSLDKSKFVINENYLLDLTNILDRKNYKSIYLYNQKSGVTLCLLQMLEIQKELYESRYFHFNAEFIENYKKKYFYFKISKLFKKDEKKIYEDIIKKSTEEIIDFDIELIVDVLKKVIKKFNNIEIIFDNIKNEAILDKIMNLENELRKVDTKNKFFFIIFIAINSSTLGSIKGLDTFSTIFPTKDSYNQELPLMEYLHSLFSNNDEDKKNAIEKYKNDVKDTLECKKDDSIDFLIFITKLLHNNSFPERNEFLYYKTCVYFVKFLPYLYISLNQNLWKVFVNQIQFRANFIKEIINNIFNLLITQNILTNDIFKQIKTKSTEGIYIEKEIIFSLIINNINFDKMKIEKIYCFDPKIVNNIEKSEIIIIQEQEYAPIYDFGIITTIKDVTIFNGYQIGINKPRKSLSNLFKQKIIIDSLYFINKINKFLKKKITKFTFGIITTIDAYNSQENSDIETIINDNCFEYEFGINEDKKEEANDKEYKNYNIMKEYCNDNNFEFIIFDPKNTQFYVIKNKILEQIDFSNYSNPKFENKVSNFIFNDEKEEENLIKLPLNSNEITKRDIDFIHTKVNNIENKQLNFIAKFKREKKNNKTIIFETIKEINFNDLINNNYLIYAKDKYENKTIFFEKKYFLKEYKNADIFYVFDASLDIKRKKKDDSQNIEKSIEVNKGKGNNYLNRKTKRTKSPKGKKQDEN